MQCKYLYEDTYSIIHGEARPERYYDGKLVFMLCQRPDTPVIHNLGQIMIVNIYHQTYYLDSLPNSWQLKSTKNT